MRALLAVAWAVAAFCLPAFSQAHCRTTLIISLREGDRSGVIRFDGSTISGDMNYFFDTAFNSVQSAVLGERVNATLVKDAYQDDLVRYGGFYKQGHTLIYMEKRVTDWNVDGRFVHREDGTFTQYIDIKDNGSCSLRKHARKTFSPEDQTYRNSDENLQNTEPATCSWVPERSPEASVQGSGVARTCEGGVSTSERQTSSNFCITIINQCGFPIMARLSRTDRKNGGSFKVGANPTTVCSDNLDWKYELDGYLPRPGD